MTDTAEKQKTEFAIDEGDHERLSHYVRKDDLDKAILDGIPIRALCGKLWLPTKDANRFPVCKDCQQIMDEVVGSNLPEGERG